MSRRNVCLHKKPNRQLQFCKVWFPNTEFFLTVFFRIQTEYRPGKLRKWTSYMQCKGTIFCTYCNNVWIIYAWIVHNLDIQSLERVSWNSTSQTLCHRGCDLLNLLSNCLIDKRFAKITLRKKLDPI